MGTIGTGSGVVGIATVVLWLGLPAGTGLAQAPPRDRTADRPPRHEKQGTHYFAVLGAVGRPGAYALPAASPELVTLVESAGGLTDDATGQVRIVRNGHSGEQAHYSSQSTIRLFPGDVVVAQGRQGQPTFRRSAHSRTAEDPGREAPIWVALVHVIDRPVVVPMRPGQATLKTIVRSLNQPTEVLWSVTAIAPGFRPTRLGPESSPEVPLPTGTVLVFDPSALHPEHIPALPGPYRIDSGSASAKRGASDLEPKAGGPSQRQGSNTTAASWETEIRSAAKATVQTSGAEQAVQLGRDLTEDGSTSGPPRPFPQADRTAATPAFPSAQSPNSPATRPEDRRSPVPAVLQHDRAPSESDAQTLAGSPRGLETEPIPEPESPKNASRTESAPDWVINVVGFLGGSVTLAAAFLLWSMARRATARTGATGEGDIASGLEALIRNRLPLVEEPVELPPRQQLADRPVSHGTARADGDHALQGPHFRIHPGEDPPEDAEDRRPRLSGEDGHSPSPVTAGGPRYRIDSVEGPRSAERGDAAPSRSAHSRDAADRPPHIQPSGLLDRVLAAVHETSLAHSGQR